MMKTVFGMTVLAALVPILMVGATGTATACPFGKTAQTTGQQTTASSDQVPLPADGSKTETKTGG
jgi:hypothetical protein